MNKPQTYETREAWLAARERDVTASVIGCLLPDVGHPYVSPGQLHLIKSGQAIEEQDETPAMQRGRLMEGVAVELLRERHPDWRIAHNRLPNLCYWRDFDRRIGATPDVIVNAPDREGFGIIQIKSVIAPAFASWKDEAGELAAPEWIVAQATVEAKLTGAQWAMIAALVLGYAGLDLHLIEVDLQETFWRRLSQATVAFWEAIERGEAPDLDPERDGRLVTTLWPTDDGSIIDLSGDNAFIDAVHQRRRLDAEAKTIKDELEHATAVIKLKMGPHAFATAGDFIVSHKSYARKGYTVAPSTARRLNIRKRKDDE